MSKNLTKKKKTTIIIISFIILLCALTSFLIYIFLYIFPSDNTTTQDSEWTFSYKVAREVQSDGWVYTFKYFYFNDGTQSNTVPPYAFNVMNLRYRYGDDTYETPMQIYGFGTNEDIAHDMRELDDLLAYHSLPAPSVDEMLSLSTDDLEFKSIDENLFIRLVQEALTGEACVPGNYTIPEYALLAEPDYEDDYSIQIGFMAVMGRVDVMLIDVIYPTGTGKYDFVQLSDMVENNTATDEQRELYSVLNNIAQGIVESGNMQYGFNEFENQVIAGTKIERLYTFIDDIVNGNWANYSLE